MIVTIECVAITVFMSIWQWLFICVYMQVSDFWIGYKIEFLPAKSLFNKDINLLGNSEFIKSEINYSIETLHNIKKSPHIIAFKVCIYEQNIYLLKALLRVLYDKIQHKGLVQVANTAQGKAECCICHETPPWVLYFIIQHEYMVLLLICWFCVGGLITLCIEVWENGFAKMQKQAARTSYYRFVITAHATGGKWMAWKN